MSTVRSKFLCVEVLGITKHGNEYLHESTVLLVDRKLVVY